MIRLVHQFDDARLPGGVATPTCCCCCCLVTTVTSSTLVGVHLSETAVRREARSRRVALTVAGVSSMTLVWMVVAVIGRLFNYGDTDTGFFVTIAAGCVAWFGSLMWLYREARVEISQAAKTAGFIVVLTSVSFIVEFFTLGFLLLGQFLAVPVPIAAGIFMHRRMRRDT